MVQELGVNKSEDSSLFWAVNEDFIHEQVENCTCLKANL